LPEGESPNCNSKVAKGGFKPAMK
jgi:hypothetical protein